MTVVAANAAQQLQGIGAPDWLREGNAQQAIPSATEPQAGSDAPIDPLGAASLGQTALGLVAVIALILVCAMLLKRFGPYKRFAGGRALKLVAGQSVGSRERVVVLEVEDTWLVLGVTPNNVNLLHKLPAQRATADGPVRRSHAGGRPPFTQAFAENLRQACSRWSRH